MRDTSTALRHAIEFENGDALDDTLLEAAITVLKYTDGIVKQWTAMGVDENEIARCIDAAARLYRYRCSA